MKNLVFTLLFACPIILASILTNLGCGSSPSGPAPCTGGNVGLNSTDGTNTTTTDHLYASRYQFTHEAKVTDIRINVCGSAGTTFNVGIYSDGTSAPGTLVSPVISQEVTACAGVTLDFSGGGVDLPAGYYWLAVGSSQAVEYLLTNATGTNEASYGPGSGLLPATFPSSSVFSFASAPEISADWVCP